jgi:hypothetical protein
VVGVQHLPPNPAEPPGDLEGEAEKSPGRLAPCGVAGSWDPVGAWAERGGRVVVTALTCMSLEVYYRYSRSAFAK